MDLAHPYEKLTLVQVGWPIALYLLVTHAVFLLKPQLCQDVLRKLPRNYNAGVVTMLIAMVWFWVLVAIPPGFPVLGKYAMNLAEFTTFVPVFRLAVPIICIGMIIYSREFLFVRALAFLCFLVAGPLLQGAMFKDEATRVLVPIFTYIIIIGGLIFGGYPYLFRDLVNWVTADQKRWTVLSVAGFAYGIAVLACTLMFW